MSRLTDVDPAVPRAKIVPLPPVDWASVGHAAPQRVEVNYQGPDAPLPEADVAVLTWTSAEWSALDHVFLGSTHAGRPPVIRPACRTGTSTRATSACRPDRQPGAPLWGYYALVDVASKSARDAAGAAVQGGRAPRPSAVDRRVSMQMTQQILDDTRVPHGSTRSGPPAAAARISAWATSSITNAGHIQLQKPDNIGGADHERPDRDRQRTSRRPDLLGPVAARCLPT